MGTVDKNTFVFLFQIQLRKFPHFLRLIMIGLNSRNTIQPAEFAKLGLIIYLSALIAKKKEVMKDFKQGLLPCLIVTSVFVILIALQPDYGTAFILATTAGIIIMTGGTNLKHIFYIFVNRFALGCLKNKNAD